MYTALCIVRSEHAPGRLCAAAETLLAHFSHNVLPFLRLLVLLLPLASAAALLAILSTNPSNLLSTAQTAGTSDLCQATCTPYSSAAEQWSCDSGYKCSMYSVFAMVL